MNHITGVLSEHQAGKLLDIPDTGIRGRVGARRRPLFPGGRARTGWGGNHDFDPLYGAVAPFRCRIGRVPHDHADGQHDRRACGLL